MNLRSRLSLIVIQIFIISLMVALLGRLFYLQVAAAPRYKDAALSIQSRDVVTPATRGLIVDASGVPLALNKVGVAITVDRTVIDKQETGSRFQPIPITKDADPSLALQIVERSDQYPGISAAPVAIRSYPGNADVNAAHMLGYIGPLTEGDLAGENGRTYFRSEYIGKSGLEIQYDEFLRGTPGIKTFTVDRKESVTNTRKVTNPIPGNHLVTSIDVRLQAASEKALAAAVARSRASGYRADGAAAVVMDVVTGRILALASYPTFDPNAYERGLTTQQARDLYSEAAGVPALSRALQGVFAPASTFKAVSLVAAANAGYNLNANYECPGDFQVGTRLFRNFDSKNQGTLSMKKAIAVSCDTIWYKIAFAEWLKDGGLRPKSNPNDFFFKAAEGFQVGQRTGIDLPSESSGRLANREWRLSWYEQNKDFYCNYKERASKEQQTAFLLELARENCLDGDKIRAGDAVNFSIGQGDTVITPLKLTQMYAAIANGGTIWKPTIGKAIVTTEGKILETISPEKIGTLPATKATLKFLKSSLREVNVSGTGAGAFSGFPIAISGKTGTAQVFGRNANGTLKSDTSWYAGYGPSDKPRYAVVMMVSQGGFGASSSGIGVRQIFESIFGVKGSTIVPGAAIYPEGKPPTVLPKISPATKVKVAP